MFNPAEFFGVDASDVFDRKMQAEGYIAGCAIATKMLNACIEEMRDKPRAYKEAVLQALREQL